MAVAGWLVDEAVEANPDQILSNYAGTLSMFSCCYEWDEAKRLANLARHGYDFGQARCVSEHPNVMVLQLMGAGGVCYIDLAEVEGRLVALLYTWHGATVRLISLRSAKSQERNFYYEVLVGCATEAVEPVADETDWARVGLMTDEEIEAADSAEEGICEDWMARAAIVHLNMQNLAREW
jgi:uncharacterized DUF497 family protein